MHLLHMHTHALPVTMTSPAVCLGPLPGFGRGWGGMLKKPGEAKHTVPQWGWREVEAWSEGGGGWMLSLSLLFLTSSQSAETPCVSAKRWSIPSVYFTYFCCSPCLSLSLSHPDFPVCSFSYVLSLLSMFGFFLLMAVQRKTHRETKCKVEAETEIYDAQVSLYEQVVTDVADSRR